MAMFNDLVKVFEKKENIKCDVIPYSDEKLFLSDIRKGRLDFAMSMRVDGIYDVLKSGKMKPIFQFETFGEERYRYCLYVKKSRNMRTLADIKGLRLASYEDMIPYFYLREITKVPPEDYFVMKMSPNPSSSIYALGLGDADVLFTIDFNLEYFRLTNPGPVKDLVSIACSDSIPRVPFFASVKVNPAVAEKIFTYTAGIDKEEELKKYRPLVKMMKSKPTRVTTRDYAGLMAMYETGVKKGWDKDFRAWLKYSRQK